MSAAQSSHCLLAPLLGVGCPAQRTQPMLRFVQYMFKFLVMCQICTSMSCTIQFADCCATHKAKFDEAIAKKLQSSKYGATSIEQWKVSNFASALYIVLCLHLGIQPFTQHPPVSIYAVASLSLWPSSAMCNKMSCSYQQLLPDWCMEACCQPHSRQAAKQQHCLPCWTQSLLAMLESFTACHAGISHCLPCWNQSLLAMLESVTACHAGVGHCLPCWNHALFVMLESVTACHAGVSHCLPCWSRSLPVHDSQLHISP